MQLSIVVFVFAVTISATPLGDPTRLGISERQLSCDQAQAQLQADENAYQNNPNYANQAQVIQDQQNVSVSLNPQHELNMQLESME
jgi:hypothetical protein